MAVIFAGCESNDFSNEENLYVKTGEPMDIGRNFALVTGVVNVAITDYESVQWGIMYSVDKNELASHNGNIVYSNDTLSNKMFSVCLTNLEEKTTYYYRAFVSLDNDQYQYGNIKNFTTIETFFSVSNTTRVKFSSGNLQYHPANNKWRFAEYQTDYIGKANANLSSNYNGWIDLFAWGTGNAPISSVDYSTFVDWGTNKIDIVARNTWRTLTEKEWNYLLIDRNNASCLCGVAQVQDSLMNTINGLILLPDNWICPQDIIFKSGFHSNYGTAYYADYQTFTVAQWSELEAAGAVFLPAAGGRYHSNMYGVQEYGHYWSSTEYNRDDAYSFGFNSDDARVGYSPRHSRHSVRLVKGL